MSLKEADLVGTVSGLVKNKSAPAELLCNVLTLVRSLSAAGEGPHWTDLFMRY